MGKKIWATDAQRREAKRIISKWKSQLFLNEWFIDIRYDPEQPACEPGYDVHAQVSANPTYMTAVIWIYPSWAKVPKDRREHLLVHELCHLLTQEAWDAMKKLHREGVVTADQQREIMEKLTQRIANAVFRECWT